MLSTSRLRTEYAPPCTSDRSTLHLHGDGRVSVRNVTVDAYRALNAVLTKWSYRTRRADTGAYNCRRITGGSGWSLHAYGIAADLNWLTNPYGQRLVTDMEPGMVAEIKRIRTRNGRQVFGWGGDYRSVKDAMHYEIVCSLADLRTGIDPATVTGAFVPPSKPGMPATRQQVRGTWREGDRGAGVHFMQAMLNITQEAHGGPVLALDGIFGARTREALVAFQRFGRAMGQIAGTPPQDLLVVDGIAGPRTNGAIGFWVRVVLGA